MAAEDPKVLNVNKLSSDFYLRKAQYIDSLKLLGNESICTSIFIQRVLDYLVSLGLHHNAPFFFVDSVNKISLAKALSKSLDEEKDRSGIFELYGAYFNKEYNLIVVFVEPMEEELSIEVRLVHELVHAREKHATFKPSIEINQPKKPYSYFEEGLASYISYQYRLKNIDRDREFTDFLDFMNYEISPERPLSFYAVEMGYGMDLPGGGKTRIPFLYISRDTNGYLYNPSGINAYTFSLLCELIPNLVHGIINSEQSGLVGIDEPRSMIDVKLGSGTYDSLESIFSGNTYDNIQALKVLKYLLLRFFPELIY